MDVVDMIKKYTESGKIETKLGQDEFAYILKLIYQDVNEDKLIHTVNCSGCGRTIEGEVPIPSKGSAFDTTCGTCGYLLVSYRFEEKTSGEDAL